MVTDSYGGFLENVREQGLLDNTSQLSIISNNFGF
jgi:hypothetical protein